MNASASSALAPALMLLAGLASAQAQVGPPVRLVPQAPAAAPALEAPPPAFAPGAPSAMPPPPIPRGETVPRLPSVRVDPLQAPDPSNVGLIDPARGGLPFDMWRGTRLATVQALMPKLPVAAPSPVMQELMRRLLLSTAAPPAGSGGPSLLGLRVERLAAAGRIADAAELLKAAGARLEDPALALARIDAALLGNDTDAACAAAKDEIAKRPTPGTAKVAAFCQAAAGEKTAAALAGDLLREQGQKDDAYFLLLDQLTGARKVGKIASLKQPSPLHLAMLRAAKQNIPEDALREAPPAVLRAIATAPNAAPELRLDAAERAEAAGALSTEELARIYAEAKLPADSKRNPRNAAALYLLAQAEGEDGKKLDAMRKALAQARTEGRFAGAARLWREVALAVPPSGALEPAAGDMARVLLALGELGKARDWMQFDRNATPELWPLGFIAEGGRGPGWAPQRLREWLGANEARDGSAEVKARRAQLLFAVLEALGYGVGDAEWDSALAGPTRVQGDIPAPAVWRSLRQSAIERRTGETVLTAMVAIGDGGPGRVHPAVIATAIGGLRAARLEAEARTLALEALLAGGL
jgi:hypothetical protein